jgi:hypothetical protein
VKPYSAQKWPFLAKRLEKSRILAISSNVLFAIFETLYTCTPCNGRKFSDLYSGMHLYTKRPKFFEAKKSALCTHFWCMHHCLGFVYKCMHHNAGEYGTSFLIFAFFGDFRANFHEKLPIFRFSIENFLGARSVALHFLNFWPL